MRITDLYTNPAMGGAVSAITSMSTATLLVGGLPVLRLTDPLLPVPDQIMPTGKTVYHGGLPLVGQLDPTASGGQMVLGAFTTLIS